MISEDYHCVSVSRLFGSPLSRSIFVYEWPRLSVALTPGKPRYDIPKAYRPVALVNTIAKLLSSIVAEDLVHLMEKHALLPANHFGGRPGRTMMDSLHLLVDTVKAAWHRKQVVSVLFLDVEGAFPNAVMERLLHNLWKRRVPEGTWPS